METDFIHNGNFFVPDFYNTHTDTQQNEFRVKKKVCKNYQS